MPVKAKMERVFEKARPHKYIRREGAKGKYQYFYGDTRHKISDDVAYLHQLKVAQDTLNTADAMVGVMGGPTKEEARKFLGLAADGSQDHKARTIREEPGDYGFQPGRTKAEQKHFDLTGEEPGEYKPGKPIDIEENFKTGATVDEEEYQKLLLAKEKKDGTVAKDKAGNIIKEGKEEWLGAAKAYLEDIDFGTYADFAETIGIKYAHEMDEGELEEKVNAKLLAHPIVAKKLFDMQVVNLIEDYKGSGAGKTMQEFIDKEYSHLHPAVKQKGLQWEAKQGTPAQKKILKLDAKAKKEGKTLVMKEEVAKINQDTEKIKQATKDIKDLPPIKGSIKTYSDPWSDQKIPVTSAPEYLKPGAQPKIDWYSGQKIKDLPPIKLEEPFKPAPTKALHEPTDAEWGHEKMRINNAMTGSWGEVAGKGEQKLRSRMSKIAQAQKMYNFARALEDENIHQLAGEAYDHLHGMGYGTNGQPLKIAPLKVKPPIKDLPKPEDIKLPKKHTVKAGSKPTAKAAELFEGRRIDLGQENYEKSFVLEEPFEKMWSPAARIASALKRRAEKKAEERDRAIDERAAAAGLKSPRDKDYKYNPPPKEKKSKISLKEKVGRAASAVGRGAAEFLTAPAHYDTGKAIVIEEPFLKGRGPDKKKRKSKGGPPFEAGLKAQDKKTKAYKEWKYQKEGLATSSEYKKWKYQKDFD